MDKFQLVNDVQKTCEALHFYHLQVSNNYQEIVDYLENIEATTLTANETDDLVNLVALPIIEIFEKMETTKAGSPEYIYRLICHAYTTYKHGEEIFKERIET